MIKEASPYIGPDGEYYDSLDLLRFSKRIHHERSYPKIPPIFSPEKIPLFDPRLIFNMNEYRNLFSTKILPLLRTDASMK